MIFIGFEPKTLGYELRAITTNPLPMQILLNANFGREVNYFLLYILLSEDASRDKAFKTDGTAQQIVWSVGPINSLGQAAKHYVNNGRITS